MKQSNSPPPLSSRRLPSWVVFIIVCVLTGAAYHNALTGDFAYDDHFAIKNNPDATGKSNFWDLWSHDYWGQDISREDSHKSYRPLTIISYRINYVIHERFFNDTADGHGSYKRLMAQLHLSNIVLHAVVSWQVYWVSEGLLMLGSPVSVLAAGFFATHPVHTEAITGLVGRAEPLSSIFCISALVVYWRWMNSKSIKSTHPLSFSVLMWAAMLCKETAFTYLGMAVILDAAFHVDLIIAVALRKKPITSLFPIIVRSTWVVANAAAYLWFRKWITVHTIVMNYRRLENPIAFSSSRMERILSNTYLYVRYVWLLFWPHPLSCDYSFNCIPLVTSLLDPRNLFGAMLYVSIVALTLVGLAFRRTFGWKILAIAGLLILPFIPAANIFFFVGTMMGERLLYLPSVGFCVGLVWLLHATLMKVAPSHRLHLTTVISITIISLYIVQSYNRNIDWENEGRLFFAAEQVCPDSAKVHFNLAILEINRKNYKRALYHLDRTDEIEPNHCESSLQRGLLAWGEKRSPREAVEHFNKAIECKYTMAKAVENLNLIYQALTQAYPDNVFFVEQWAAILEKVGKNEDAAIYYTQAGIGFKAKMNNVPLALKAFETAVKLDSSIKTSLAHIWLGDIYSSMEMYDKALASFWAAGKEPNKWEETALAAFFNLYDAMPNSEKNKHSAVAGKARKRALELQRAKPTST